LAVAVSLPKATSPMGQSSLIATATARSTATACSEFNRHSLAPLLRSVAFSGSCCH
jgi:hypothetical protein